MTSLTTYIVYGIGAAFVIYLILKMRKGTGDKTEVPKPVMGNRVIIRAPDGDFEVQNVLKDTRFEWTLTLYSPVTGHTFNRTYHRTQLKTANDDQIMAGHTTIIYEVTHDPNTGRTGPDNRGSQTNEYAETQAREALKEEQRKNQTLKEREYARHLEFAETLLSGKRPRAEEGERRPRTIIQPGSEGR